MVRDSGLTPTPLDKDSSLTGFITAGAERMLVSTCTRLGSG